MKERLCRTRIELKCLAAAHAISMLVLVETEFRAATTVRSEWQQAARMLPAQHGEAGVAHARNKVNDDSIRWAAGQPVRLTGTSTVYR